MEGVHTQYCDVDQMINTVIQYFCHYNYTFVEDLKIRESNISIHIYMYVINIFYVLLYAFQDRLVPPALVAPLA